MRQLLLTAIFALVLFTGSYAQGAYEIGQALDFYRNNRFSSGDWKTTLSESDIEGSPYLNDEFVTGTVYTTLKQKFVDLPLRYNIYNDQIEFKTPDDEIQALGTPEIVEAVEFGDLKMVYVPFTNNKKVRHGFFKIELEGRASLYSRSNLMFKKAEEAGAYKEAVPAKFVNQPDSYYIKMENAQARKINNKKELAELFPDHQNEISAFIKKNKIKTNKPEKLKELVSYYNSL